MPNLSQTFTFEKVSSLIQDKLQKSMKLNYVPDASIVVTSILLKDTEPTFTSYFIKISPPDAGFLVKIPKIGNHYENIYTVAIELWIKSSGNVTSRLTSGKIDISKGIYEFFQDVSDILEHNNFDNQLDPYPGTSIDTPALLKGNEKSLIEGLGFLWHGRQFNYK